jgi:hypothetical protein
MVNSGIESYTPCFSLDSASDKTYSTCNSPRYPSLLSLGLHKCSIGKLQSPFQPPPPSNVQNSDPGPDPGSKSGSKWPRSGSGIGIQAKVARIRILVQFICLLEFCCLYLFDKKGYSKSKAKVIVD